LVLGPALSAHLQVPLPYLLYRAQVRYEEDLRGLQDIRSTLTTSNSQTARPSGAEGPRQDVTSGTGVARGSSRLGSSSIRGHGSNNSAHTRILSQPTLGNRLLRDRASPALASSQYRGSTPITPRRVPTPPASEPSDSDSELDKEEEEGRKRQEEEAVAKRLKELEKMMSSGELGFARPPRLRAVSGPSNIAQRSPLREVVQRADSTDTSESGAPSPQGSIPSIPSPPPESHSQTSSSTRSSNQATTLPLNVAALSPHSPRTRQHLAVRGIQSQRGSNHGSAASSFSDLSDVSASALESALMSNIRGAGSRLYVPFISFSFVRSNDCIDQCSLEVISVVVGEVRVTDVLIRCNLAVCNIYVNFVPTRKHFVIY